MKIKINKGLYLNSRKIHLYAGLLMIPFLFLFGLSGFLFNHSTFFHGRDAVVHEIESWDKPSRLLPDLEMVSQQLMLELSEKGVLKTDMVVSDIGFEDNLVIRSAAEKADYRLEYNLSNDHVKILTLPDFAQNATVDYGKVTFGEPDLEAKLIDLSDRILKGRGLQPGNTGVQRMPFMVFHAADGKNQYRVGFNIINGSYFVDDMNKKSFKLDYFLLNLHQEHGYPIGEFNMKTLWVLFADALSILFMIWAITGLIMWLKLRKHLVLGLILISLSLLLVFALCLHYGYLGY
ncbi:MAG: hypothetical protein Tsb004_28110 [Allomuricauda sp.]